MSRKTSEKTAQYNANRVKYYLEILTKTDVVAKLQAQPGYDGWKQYLEPDEPAFVVSALDHQLSLLHRYGTPQLLNDNLIMFQQVVDERLAQLLRGELRSVNPVFEQTILRESQGLNLRLGREPAEDDLLPVNVAGGLISVIYKATELAVRGR